MSDVNWAAYNAFRCDLAKVHKTFSCCTQTEFTEEVGTITELSLGCKFLGGPVPRKILAPARHNNGKGE
ncbi:uncharacterized protein LOC115763446 [Drosophila novamexicana]|uniref:uncharacterized protein LOC115763446 n=1 Tax=Drosophila novamexicana TaxID=47314 RepID=UPI0011E5C46B|nr:uncharacterized protein LOC115763446 [Drosophila novamexicana]